MRAKSLYSILKEGKYKLKADWRKYSSSELKKDMIDYFNANITDTELKDSFISTLACYSDEAFRSAVFHLVKQGMVHGQAEK